MADNGHRDAGGRIIAQRRMAAAAQADVDDAPRGMRWELLALAAALCGLAIAGAHRYGGASVQDFTWKAKSWFSSLSRAASTETGCPTCQIAPTTLMSAVAAPAPASAEARSVGAATGSAAHSVEPVFALDPRKVCFERGLARDGRIAALRTARVSDVAVDAYADPKLHAALAEMTACLLDEAADRACDAPARAILLSELSAYVAGAKGAAVPSGKKRGATAERGVAPVVIASVARHVEAGRLRRADFSAKAGFQPFAPELARLFAGAKARRSGCAGA